MAINLNDSQYEVKSTKIFNGGSAGVVKGITVTVEKRKATDPDNKPKYQVVMTDAAGGVLNRGYFGLKTDASDGAKTFFVKEMKHVFGLAGVEAPSEIESYDALLDAAVKALKGGAEGKTFNTVVSYGTSDRPNKYLEIGSAFQIVPAAEEPYVNAKLLMVRPTPTQEEVDAVQQKIADAPADSKSDLPW